MSTATRKQREIAQREELMVDAAQKQLLEKGFQQLSMDHVAAEVEYSKGTVYQHFATKEDLVLAVATRALKGRADAFEQAAAFDGSTRERISAIGFSCVRFAREHPDYFHIEMMLKSASFWEKSSDQRKEAHAVQGGRCFRSMNTIIHEALALGDLPKSRFSAEKIAFSLAALTMGTHIMGEECELVRMAGIEDPARFVREYQEFYLDSLGWTPLFNSQDLPAYDERFNHFSALHPA